MTLSHLTAPAGELPTGAALIWTDADPGIAAARELIMRGKFAQAQAALERMDSESARQGMETIRRIRHDYSLDQQAVYEKLKPRVRDLSLGDVLKWRDAGQLQHRIIDDQTWYFRREPSNLFRFCPEAVARQVRQPEDKNVFVLENHLATIIKEAKATGRDQVLPTRHRITFKLTVPTTAAGFKKGAMVRAWLPYPQDYRQQTGVRLIGGTAGAEVSKEGASQRTLYFQKVIEDGSRSLVFDAVYEYTSSAYYPVLADDKAQGLPANFPAEHLQERPPHIVFTPAVRTLVKEIVGDETNPLRKARRIFHWVDGNIKYNAEEEYAIIPSFTMQALTRRRGDCGVQGMTFITLCRAAGVPARWQSGWQTKPGSLNMHDWAEFYVAPWGWLPCDPSYGLQKSADPAIREFYFGHQDAYRMIVNLDYGRELSPPKKSLRSEPADFQRGEVEIDGRNLYYDQFEHEFVVKQL